MRGFLMHKMEKYKPDQRIINGSFKHLQGKSIEIWPEFNHLTTYSEIKVANLNKEKCSICKKGKPIIIRYEHDHWMREFYDIYCESCAPERILNILKGNGR